MSAAMQSSARLDNSIWYPNSSYYFARSAESFDESIVIAFEALYLLGDSVTLRASAADQRTCVVGSICSRGWSRSRTTSAMWRNAGHSVTVGRAGVVSDYRLQPGNSMLAWIESANMKKACIGV
jgi:hypothetical protein